MSEEPISPARFSQPDPAEEDQVRAIFAKAKTLDDVFKLLGAPDFDYPDNQPCGEWLDRRKRSLIYSTTFETITLTLMEHVNGKISFAWGAKYLCGAADP